MPKYWGKQIFAHGRFPEVGQKQKTEKKERGGAKVGDNNGQATHGARKHAWRTQAAWAKKERAKVGDNNGQATHVARKPPGPIFQQSKREKPSSFQCCL